MGHFAFQQHRNGDDQTVFFTFRTELSIAWCNASSLSIELTVGQFTCFSDIRKETGVCAGLVAVCNDQHGCGRIELEHNVFGQSSVAACRFSFFQDIIKRAVCMMLIREAEGRAIFSGKGSFAIFFGCQSTDCIALNFIVGNISAVIIFGCCCIQFKFYAFQRVTVLVYLFNAVVEGGLEVEAHLQAGIVVPALQIKHLQAVFGAGGKDFFPAVIGHPMERIRLFPSQGGFKPFI